MYNKVLTKGCTRCGGDLFLEPEADGLHLACIQCGAVNNELSRLLKMCISSQTKGERVSVPVVAHADKRVPASRV